MKDEKIPFLTGKEETILALLMGREKAYGIELVKASDGILKRGGIYPILSKMKEYGWVESWIEEAEKGYKGPPRRLYRITANGSRVLEAWNVWKAAIAGSVSSKLTFSKIG